MRARDPQAAGVPRLGRLPGGGWHGSALTLGSALGAPAIGQAIDSGGWADGFLYGGLTSLVIALTALLVTSRRRSAHVAAPEAATPLEGRSVADEAVATTL